MAATGVGIAKLSIINSTSMLHCYEQEYQGALTATRPWSCVLGHQDESSCIPPPPSPAKGADSVAYYADQAGCP